MDSPVDNIPLIDAEFILAYQCSTCGETIFLAQTLFDFLVEGRKLKKPVECPACSFKKAFSLMPKQSSIRRIREFKPQSKEDDISISTLYSPRDPQLKIVLDTIREMGLISEVVSEDELIKTLMDEHEIKNDEARKLIITLMREGDIYSPKPGYYKKTL